MKKSIVYVLLVLLVYHILFKSPIPGKIMMIDDCVFTYGETYERVWDAYDELPPKVKDMFEDNGYRMYVVSLIDNDDIITGQTRFIPRIVLIKNSETFAERTLFHECGHILDDELSLTFISQSDEFESIYDEERMQFRADNNIEYFISTPMEYFASAFSEYMIRPARLKYNTPKTYDFIEQCLK